VVPTAFVRVLILGLSLNICWGNGFSSNGLLVGGLRVFFIAEKPENRGVRDRLRHLGRARKSVWGE